jgi:hypothetical protein
MHHSLQILTSTCTYVPTNYIVSFTLIEVIGEERESFDTNGVLSRTGSDRGSASPPSVIASSITMLARLLIIPL